jgi:hypothetical protein
MRKFETPENLMIIGQDVEVEGGVGRETLDHLVYLAQDAAGNTEGEKLVGTFFVTTWFKTHAGRIFEIFGDVVEYGSDPDDGGLVMICSSHIGMQGEGAAEGLPELQDKFALRIEHVGGLSFEPTR